MKGKRVGGEDMALLMRPEPFSHEVNRLVNTLFEAGEAGAGNGTPKAVEGTAQET